MKAGKHIQHPTNTKSGSRKCRISPSFITCSDKLIVSATGQQTAERERERELMSPGHQASVFRQV